MFHCLTSTAAHPPLCCCSSLSHCSTAARLLALLSLPLGGTLKEFAKTKSSFIFFSNNEAVDDSYLPPHAPMKTSTGKRGISLLGHFQRDVAPRSTAIIKPPPPACSLASRSLRALRPGRPAPTLPACLPSLLRAPEGLDVYFKRIEALTSASAMRRGPAIAESCYSEILA